MRRRWRAATTMVLVGATLTACSGGDDAAPGSTGPGVASTTTAAERRAPQTDPPATSARGTTTSGAVASTTTTAAPTTSPAPPATELVTDPGSSGPPPVIESAEGCSMSPTPPFVGAVPIQPEAAGDRVRELQQMLTTLGYDVGASGLDGHFGPDSQAAFQQWQAEQGAPVTGIVCMEDWYALVTATSPDDTGGSVPG